MNAAIEAAHAKTVGGIVTDITTVAESLALLTNSMEEMSAGSGQITAVLASLKDVSFEVEDSYGARAFSP